MIYISQLISYITISKIGKLIGWFIVIFFALAISTYILKFINKKYGKDLRGVKYVGKFYDISFKTILKYHKIFGILAVIFTVIHFAILFQIQGLDIKGTIAAILMIAIVLQGVYGNFKKRSKFWIFIHRFLSITLIVTIILHIL